MTIQNEPSIASITSIIDAVRSQVATVVHGQTEVIDQLLICLIAGGHVLVEGTPGVAKTLTARCLAVSVDLSYGRIQFTPDLMPSDVTGVNIFSPKTQQFEFRPGPVFTDMLLADEINRAPAKTQASLLEGMQEGQVSVDGKSYPLPDCFMVVATQNPIEFEGTYPLPEAQLDRFLMKVRIDYPAEASELAMLHGLNKLGDAAKNPVKNLSPQISKAQLLQLRALTHTVQVDDSVMQYILNIIRNSRQSSHFQLGASPRAGFMLLQVAKAYAVLQNKQFVTPDDVAHCLVPTLRHRVQLTPEAQIEGMTPDFCLNDLLTHVAIPR